MAGMSANRIPLGAAKGGLAVSAREPSEKELRELAADGAAAATAVARPRNLKAGADEEMLEKTGKKKKAKAPKTLKIVLETLIDRRVDIELRDDTVINGTLDSVDLDLNLELSNVRFRRVNATEETKLEVLFLNGRYVRYVHIPEGVEVVKDVHKRVVAQGKARTGHRRTADVIREAIERRQVARDAQDTAVARASGGPIPAAAQARMEEKAAADAVKAAAIEAKKAAAQATAEAAGFADIQLSCKGCKEQFTWTAGTQQYYEQKGLTNAPKRCTACLKAQRERRKEKEDREQER
jgi:small nuclear ribonucleoprotein (snRNP)-like protein